MSNQNLIFKQPIILFGNGEISKHKKALKIINNATTFICLDGGADKLKNLGFEPDIILGDLDSITQNYNCEIVQLQDPSKSDLEKGILWCLEKKITQLYLVGFSGKRDDHYFSTLWTMLKYCQSIKLHLYTNFSKIICVKDKKTFKSVPNQTISIIVPKNDILITTSKLKYPLQSQKISSPTQGVSNMTTGNEYSIEASDWIWLFENYSP